MKDFNSRRKRQKNYLYHPLSIFLMFIVLIILLKSTYNIYEKKKKADREQDKFNERYESLLKKKEELSQNINKLKTEDGLKEEIKKKYDVGEDGEVIIHITN